MPELIPGFRNGFCRLIKAQPHSKAKGVMLMFSFVTKSFKASEFSKKENATPLVHLKLQCLPFVISSKTSHCFTFLLLKTLGQRAQLKCAKHLSQFSKPLSANPSPQTGILADLSCAFSSFNFLVAL